MKKWSILLTIFFFSLFFCTLKYGKMIRISNMSFFRFCRKNEKIDWPKCARTCSQATVLRKLFGVRFSCKHCNFSRVCLLVKMVSKTVTRSFPRGKMNGYVLELCQTFSQPSPRHLLPHIDAQYMKSFIVPAGKSSIEVNLDPADEVGSEQDWSWRCHQKRARRQRYGVFYY